MSEEIRIDGSDEVSPFFATFFESQSEVSCYLLGYVFARGWITQAKNNLTLRLQHNLNTINLYRIKEILHIQKSVTPLGSLHIQSNSLCNSLISLGMKIASSNKPHITKFPDIAPAMVRHFVRGYFDGKGLLAIRRPTGRDEIDRNFELPLAYARGQCYFLSKALMEKTHAAIVNTGGPPGSMFRRFRDYMTDFVLEYKGNGLKALYWYLYEDAVYFDPTTRAQFEAIFSTIHEQDSKTYYYWKKYYKDRIDIQKPTWLTLSQWRKLSIDEQREVLLIEKKMIEEDLIYNIYSENPERLNELSAVDRKDAIEKMERARVRAGMHNPNNFSL